MKALSARPLPDHSSNDAHDSHGYREEDAQVAVWDEPEDETVVRERQQKAGVKSPPLPKEKFD